MRALSRAWLPLVLALSSVAVTLAAAEAVLRVLRPRATRLVEYPCFYEEDPRFGYRYRPDSVGRIGTNYAIRINSVGFHDAEPLPPEASDLRVLVVGDSFTAALGVTRDRTFTAVLEAELRTRGWPRADVVNLGIDGTGTDVHRDLLQAYLPVFRPDVVLLAFFANDLGDVLAGRFRRECHRGWVLSYQTDLQRDLLRARVDAHLERRLAGWLFDTSLLFRVAVTALEGERTLFRWRFVQPSRRELGLDDVALERRRPEVPKLFRQIDALAERSPARFFWVPVPPRGDLEGSLRLLTPLVRDSPIPVVDVLPAMRRLLAEEGRRADALHGRVDNHLGPTGNRIFGRAIADSVPWQP